MIKRQIYKEVGTILYMAMTYESSCRGLINHSSGPVVMKLTPGENINFL